MRDRSAGTGRSLPSFSLSSPFAYLMTSFARIPFGSSRIDPSHLLTSRGYQRQVVLLDGPHQSEHSFLPVRATLSPSSFSHPCSFHRLRPADPRQPKEPRQRGIRYPSSPLIPNPFEPCLADGSECCELHYASRTSYREEEGEREILYSTHLTRDSSDSDCCFRVCSVEIRRWV
jgi:hypothetical protein